ncbi:MAG: protein-glutamate O-methyltransferase CheR [Sphingobium sp.]|nr:protein-glutamate O-methyltransferase CheR [Sphingobium sp.]
MTAHLHNRAVDTLARLLEKHTGQQLTEARRWRVETSLRPLLRTNGLHSMDELVHVLGRAPSGPLFEQVIDLMLNHESSFFRDLNVFQSLEEAILPKIREAATEKRLRIWCAGCSTGKEAYSVAMALKHMGDVWDGWRISILGTDVSPLAIEEARRGRYTQMEMQRGLGINDLLRWFTPDGDHWQIRDEIREMVSFHADNLLSPRAVSGEFDLILCRNVLFYFPEDKRRLATAEITRHAHAGTYLVLGAGETMVGQGSCFTPCRDHRCVYVCDTAGRCSTSCSASAAR